MKKLILASNNKGKIVEFKEILNGIEIIPYGELGITEEPEETGSSFFENALIKAKTISEKTGLPAIADDSGLCVDCLNGEPGIYSARYSGGDDKQNRDKLLEEMKDVPDEQRAARFCSSVVLYEPNGTVTEGYGETTGKILHSEQGENGFGYDCIFLSDDLNISFGLASKEAKNSVSHRGRAIRSLKEKLSKRDGGESL